MPSWFRRRKRTPPPRPATDTGSVEPATPTGGDELTRIAHAHLPPDVAERWLSLTRPAAHLVAATDGEDVLARLGGRPVAPADFAWPTWEGHGPLSFIGEFDLAALSRSGIDAGVPLPSEGRLLAFYFDGSYDNGVSVVGTWDKDSLAGARLVHVAADRGDCVEHRTPTGVTEYDVHPLSGRQVTTFPNWEHPLLRREFGEQLDDREWMKHPLVADEFMGALDEVDVGTPRHQVGGWACPVQGPVELEIADAASERVVRSDDAMRIAEALAWRPLLQVDSDDAAGMMWGDVGTLYWLSKPRGSDGQPLGSVSFTWQCS